MIINDYRGINGKIERATDPIIDTDPALSPLHLTPRCYVNGTARRDYLTSVYRTAAQPLAYTQDAQP